MIFGYSTNAFVKFSLLESISRIAALGFKGIEIMGDRPHLYPPDFGARDIERVKQTIQVFDLNITNLNSFTLFAVGDTHLPSWIEPEETRRAIRIQHTLDSLNLASKLGCHNISIPPGGPLNNMPRREALDLFYRGLDRVIPLAEELNIKILIEPEPDLLIEKSDQFKSFVKDIRSPIVGLNFDIGHFFCAGEDPARSFEDLFQWIGHVHIEDIAANRVHNHLIAGQGAIRFKPIFDTMRHLGYTGDISLELYPYVDEPENAGRQSIEYLRPVLQDSGFDI
ncbi:MAG: sugar phosphate isomerase/epimerase family protein [Desulfobacterales bacterium]